MLAALLGWGQATCASKVEKSGESELTVTREVYHVPKLAHIFVFDADTSDR
jgi:electron transfer flavoprotein alpha/beta subunit